MEYVKSTVNIPIELRNELNRFVLLNMIPSFSVGINRAVELLIKELRQAEIEDAFSVAMQDKDFVERTMTCQNEMSSNDSEVSWEW